MQKRNHRLLAAALTGAALILPGFYTGLVTRRYAIPTGKLSRRVRIALVSDFHACGYGEKACRLTSAIHRGKPDLLVMTGDIFDRRQDRRNVEELLRGLEGRYPAYYVTGNHEYRDRGRSLPGNMALLARYGVKRLSGEMETVTVDGQTLNLCGVDDPEAERAPGQGPGFFRQLAALGELPREGRYTVLLSHRPEHFPFYAREGFDLALCGHAHGGQWRIPGLLNGLYAPHQGVFPRYAGGRYQKDGTTMIVSRGLALENTRVPRFYDPPELVIIDLVPEGR